MRPASSAFAPLSGAKLAIAGFVLALTNFMVVLDTTIANVSVPHIAGSLAISPTQGTWVITSYAVAEAVCVPLTGWLARRFGTVRVFLTGMAGFGLFSVLCGLSSSLAMLVAFRIGQGLCGGPLMPLSQTLMLRIFPKEKHSSAMGLWAMTTVVAPILGPILGGNLSDDLSWHWIFFINLPIALFCTVGGHMLLRRAETPVEQARIDQIGLALLLVWIGAFQIMLDLGREHDWFGSPLIVALAIVAAIGFGLFLIWELTDDSPAVDLRVFRHRGFATAMLALTCAFGTMFASLVIIPQWLQSSLGFTATWSGYVTAFNGVAAVVMAPLVARLNDRVDSRILVSFGILWMGFVSLLRTVWWTSGADFWTLAMPQLLQGAAIPFFFVPLTTLALGAVDEHETASAAGLMSFLRTLAGAVATSFALTLWSNETAADRVQLAGSLNGGEAVMNALHAGGLSAQQARGTIANLVDLQASVLATNFIFLVSAAVFLLSAALIWLAPRPARAVDASVAH